jgi:arylamine N-acetyltransferase
LKEIMGIAETQLSAHWIRRYLDLLGVDCRGPDLFSLAQLTRAHVARIPFENISSILRRKTNPSGAVPGVDFDAILDSWVDARAGGVCFEIAPMFERLLAGLGYRVHLVMADASFPGSHQALVVELGGARYLVDVGNSAPLFEPVPLDGMFEVSHAGLAFRFRADEREGDIWTMDRLIDGTWTPFMRYHLGPATAEAREAAYQRHHTPGQSWVVDGLRIMRFAQDEVQLIRDGRLTRFTTAGKHVEQIPDRAGYVRIIADVLGMPALPVGLGFDALSQRRS